MISGHGVGSGEARRAGSAQTAGEWGGWNETDRQPSCYENFLPTCMFVSLYRSGRAGGVDGGCVNELPEEGNKANQS